MRGKSESNSKRLSQIRTGAQRGYRQIEDLRNSESLIRLYTLSDSGRCKGERKRGRSIKQNEVLLTSKPHLHVTRQCGRLQMPFSHMKRTIREIISRGYRTRLMGVQMNLSLVRETFSKENILRESSKKIPPTPLSFFFEKKKFAKRNYNNIERGDK
jgi:hypothetical protein